MKILITSALPYANGPLHFGHIAGAYLPGDCYARFQRLMQNDVLYICGSDEYGVAISMSAEMAKKSPKEHVDYYHQLNSAFFQKLDFSFDHYSRTTWEGHTKVAQEFFQNLLKNGFIEKKQEMHLFSEKENKFLADRYVQGVCPKCGFEKARGDECTKCGANYEAMDLKNPKSKLTGADLIKKPSTHWYMRFDLFKERLEEWIEEKEWKASVMHFSKQFIKELKERAITRDSTWGIPVPLEEAKGKVLYVWFDAPIGYISATKEWAEKIKKPEKWQDYWFDSDTKLVHFIGKDNIPFHTVFFPAMIMGQDKPYVLPSEVPANEFFMLEGKQFSKSENWFIDMEDFFTKYTTDQIRYYLAANAPESHDADFCWSDFQLRCNSELLGKFGNFIHRTLSFTQSKCASKIPPKKLEAIDQQFLEKVEQLVLKSKEAYESFHLRKAASIIMELSQEGNTYFDAKKPWALAKDPSKLKEMQTTIRCSIECIKALALISSPIMPKTAQNIWEMLSFSTNLENLSWGSVFKAELEEGKELKAPCHLFKKIEDEQIQEEIEKLH